MYRNLLQNSLNMSLFTSVRTWTKALCPLTVNVLALGEWEVAKDWAFFFFQVPNFCAQTTVQSISKMAVLVNHSWPVLRNTYKRWFGEEQTIKQERAVVGYTLKMQTSPCQSYFRSLVVHNSVGVKCFTVTAKTNSIWRRASDNGLFFSVSLCIFQCQSSCCRAD